MLKRMVNSRFYDCRCRYVRDSVIYNTNICNGCNAVIPFVDSVAWAVVVKTYKKNRRHGGGVGLNL